MTDMTKVTCPNCGAVHVYTFKDGELSPDDRDFLDWHFTHAHCMGKKGEK